VKIDGKTLVPRQGNNSYIFPGVGLGLTVSGASRVTDEMFMAAAHALANMVTADDLRQGSLYPPLSAVREVSARIASAVATVAWNRGLAETSRPSDVLAYVKSKMYEPRYHAYTAQ
jgi:malate dehydrogenase (oxaloacetate-decarboxylating)(NADP+)